MRPRLKTELARERLGFGDERRNKELRDASRDIDRLREKDGTRLNGRKSRRSSREKGLGGAELRLLYEEEEKGKGGENANPKQATSKRRRFRVWAD